MGVYLFGDQVIDPRRFPWGHKTIDHGPGPKTLTYDSNTDTGYYGEYDLISGTNLAALLEFTEGVVQNDSSPWIKFRVGVNAICNREDADYVIYVAKKPFRSSVTWENMKAADIIDRTQTVTIDGHTFRVGLITGADQNPATFDSGTECADGAGTGSEWSSLMYRIHSAVPTCDDPTIGMGVSATTRHGGPQGGDNWASGTNVDIVVGTGDGRFTWCVEPGATAGVAVARGGQGLAGYQTFTDSFINSSNGWRPILIYTGPA